MTETERRVSAIWSDVLKVDAIGVHDNFVALGGHSLAATLCINRISDMFGVELTVEDFFLDPGDVAAIASEIDKLRGTRGCA